MSDPAHEVVNKEAALSICGGDESLFLEMSRVFMEDAFRHRKQLQRALRLGDAGAVEKHAHAIKGISLNIAALRLRDAAQALERTARQGDLTGARPLFDSCQKELERVIAVLTQIHAPQSSGT